MNGIIPHYNKNVEQQHEVIQLRRHLHQYPETGFTEYWTSSEICSYLSELGYEISYGKDLYEAAYPDIQHISDIVKINANKINEAYQSATETISNDKWLAKMQGGFTGVIARLRCTDDGPKIGFRFDIDGLPIEESKNSNHVPLAENFASKNKNMHACGHDGHTAIGLALAKQIAENRQHLAGDFYLVFQPSEEGPSGGEVFAKFDIFKQLDYLIPLHIGIIDTRKIVCGLSFLSLQSLKISFKGKNAHAAVSPEKGNNALQAACMAVTNIHGISRHGDGITRINTGQFSSNNPTNVISDYAEFELELRGENNQICKYLYDKTSDIINGIALMYGVEANIEDYGQYVNADNANSVIALLKQAALNSGMEEEMIIERHLSSACEDAPFLMNQVNANVGSASYLCLGSPTFAGHHHPEFDFDEDMLIYGVNILWEFIQCVLSDKKNNK